MLLSIALLSFWSMMAREVFSGGAVIVVPLVRHLNLLLAFVGAALAAREGKLLLLATGELHARWKGGAWISLGTTVVSCAVTGLLAPPGWSRTASMVCWRRWATGAGSVTS